MKLDWIKEIDNTEDVVKQVLRSNESLLTLFMILQKKSGIDCLISLFEEFLKNEITFTYKHIHKLKRIYVQKYNYIHPRKLALKLDLAERTVQKWLSEIKAGKKTR